MLGQRKIFPDWVEEENEKLYYAWLDSDIESSSEYYEKYASPELKAFFDERRKMIDEEYKKGVIVE